MTSPNYSDTSGLDDFADAANAIGLAAMQAMQADDYISNQIQTIAGPLGGVVQWIMDGLGTIVSDLQAFITTGETASLQSMAEFVESKIGDFVFEVIQNLQDLLDAMLGNYEGDDETLLDIQNFFAPLRGLPDLFHSLVDGIISALRNVPIIGGTVADAISELTGFKTDTQNTKRAVISGATRQDVEDIAEDPTSDSVQNAVASLRAKANQTAEVREMEYSFAKPMYEGLIPGGVVTTPIHSITTNLPTTFYDFDRGQAMALFRPVTTDPVEYCSFLGKYAAPPDTSESDTCTVVLVRWDEDTDRWIPVAESEDFAAELSSSTWNWINAHFASPYVPSIGQQLAVLWPTGWNQYQVAGTLGAANVPPYSLFPYGGGVSTPILTDALNDPAGFPMEQSRYRPTRIPFAHIAPSLGQGDVVIPPRYWYDAFDYSAMYYNFFTAGSTTARPTMNGKLSFGGSTDGEQLSVYSTPMTTSDFSAQARVSTTATWSYIMIGCDSSGNHGWGLAMNGSQSALYQYGMDWGAGGTQLQTGPGGSGTYRIEHDATAGEIRCYKNGGLIMSHTATLNNTASYRYAGLGVSRYTFISSGDWDDLLIQDMTDPEE